MEAVLPHWRIQVIFNVETHVAVFVSLSDTVGLEIIG